MSSRRSRSITLSQSPGAGWRNSLAVGYQGLSSRPSIQRQISGKIAKDLFEIVWGEGGDPRAIVEARGMVQVSDVGAIEKMVDEIVTANPDKAAQAKAKPALIGWFVGQVMRASGGRANPQAVNELLRRKLGI